MHVRHQLVYNIEADQPRPGSLTVGTTFDFVVISIVSSIVRLLEVGIPWTMHNFADSSVESYGMLC